MTPRPSSRLTAFLVGFALLHTARATAQTSAPPDTLEVMTAGPRDLPLYAVPGLTVLGDRSRGYRAARSATALKLDVPLRDVPQSVGVITRQLIADQGISGMADVVRYVPGITMGQGEGHTDQPTIRGNRSSADFFVDGMRDDAEYLRDLYNVERVEALKGPNAMIFGRGGGGGVLNRVTKQAQWDETRSLMVEAGSFQQKRLTADVGGPLGGRAAARLNAVFDDGDGFRDRFDQHHSALNPTAAVALSARTILRGGYELFDDDRRVDRGIPSYRGAPADVDPTTFFGNPDVSRATERVHAGTASLQHARGGLTLRSAARLARYDKFYQNSYSGAVDAAGTSVTLTAYNHHVVRTNLFGQTDLVAEAVTGGLRHSLLLGAEAGHQSTDEVRATGYYDDKTAFVSVPLAQPTVATPITFRPSATDADGLSTATVAALYAQDHVAFGRWAQATLGLRGDRFTIDHRNRRSGLHLERTDDLLSPRVGLVLKPVEAASLYGSWTVSYLPGSGDQLTRLTATTETLEPERFTNREVGAKWDVRDDLALTAALYRLDRTNTSAPDPSDPSHTVQTGSQRSSGLELGASGSPVRWWQVAAGFTSQRARIISRTAAARVGAEVPLVPRRTLSVWNRVQVTPALGVGLGVVRRTEMFAAIDDAVTLPGYTRADGALFVRLSDALRAQLNVENLFDARYYATSNGNNNIMPGAPRTVRISVTAGR
jgi:catecholate siderophore receptor